MVDVHTPIPPLHIFFAYEKRMLMSFSSPIHALVKNHKLLYAILNILLVGVNHISLIAT